MSRDQRKRPTRSTKPIPQPFMLGQGAGKEKKAQEIRDAIWDAVTRITEKGGTNKELKAMIHEDAERINLVHGVPMDVGTSWIGDRVYHEITKSKGE